MKLNEKERELLRTIVSLAEKALAANGAAPEAEGPRQRRSRADAAKLRKQVLAARQRKRSVAAIAQELEITPAYVYQLLR
jgi:hypothetical protein